MPNPKWADFAHYYHGISAFDKHGNLIADCSFKFGGICTEGRNMRMLSTAPINEVLTPILRALEDMTESEARELFQVFRIKKGEEWGDRKANCLHWLTDLVYKYKRTPIKMMIGKPRCWHYLISKGFDVFGLIEAKEAIRKGVENG